MIPGKRFTLADGKDYIIPPLTLRQRLELAEAAAREKLAETDSRQVFSAGCACIHMALARNYPEVRLEDMMDLLDEGLVEAISPALLMVRPEDRVTDPPKRQ